MIYFVTSSVINALQSPINVHKIVIAKKRRDQKYLQQHRRKNVNWLCPQYSL